MKQKKELGIAISIFFIISIVLSTIFIFTQREAFLQNQTKYRYIAANQSNIICDCIDTVYARTYTLSTLVMSNNGDTSFFEEIAPLIYDETQKDANVSLRNIALAPNGVVEQVYPLEGNESLIGFSFLDETKVGNSEAIAAYEEGKLLSTAPFELIQGGTGMAGRLPVYLDGSDTPWGLVTVTLDFKDLLRSLQLESLSDMKVDYELWYHDTNGDRVTIAASEHAPSYPVSYEFSVVNQSWHLDVAPSDGWFSKLYLIAGFFAIFVISLFASLLFLDQVRIKKANKKLQRLAHLDSLTSCYSRHYLNTVLIDRRNGQWRNKDWKYSLAIIDIDFFKEINDHFGHDIGDRAIIKISQILEDHAQNTKNDCVIRLGGDEFVLLLDQCSPEQFEHILRSIVRSVKKLHFPEYPSLDLSVSIGGECYQHTPSPLYEAMLKSADTKLYHSKENGRGQYTL